MKLYNCLIVDDAESDALLLQRYLVELSLFAEITVCTSYQEAQKTLLTKEFDLFFFDVMMGKDNGLKLVDIVPKQAPVIIVSSHQNYAVDSYELNVVDFLLKPVEQNRFLRSVKKALNVYTSNQSILTDHLVYLKVGRRMHRFTLSEIQFIEAYGIYTKIHQLGKVIVTNETITSLDKLLPKRHFRRVHKSYIINLDTITSYGSNFLCVNDSKIPIGASYRSEMQTIFNLIG